MKLKTISYSESRESVNPMTGLKSWQKIGVEAELEEGETFEQSLAEAREKVSSNFIMPFVPANGTFDASPHFYSPTELPVIQSKDR